MRAARIAMLAAAVFMVVATSVQYLDRPFRFDEAEFARMVRDGVLHHGVPVIPPAEQRWIRADAVPGGVPHYGMWHPPLYMYALAASAAVMPPANWAYRGVGLLCLLASLLLAWRIVGVLAPDLPAPTRALPLALVLLSPIVVEGALFIDIDGTVLPVLLLLLLERWLVWRRNLTAGRVAVLVLLFALALSAKLTTPVLAVAAMLLHALLENRRARSIAAPAAIALGGAALFVGAYVAYCKAFEYPPGYMLGLHTARASIFSVKPAVVYALALRWNLAWISPALVLLLILYGFDRAWSLLRGRRPADGADLLWIFAALNAGAYVVLAAYWGKYMAPGVIAGALGAGIWIARAWRGTSVRRPWVLAAMLASLALFAAALASPRAQTIVVPVSIGSGVSDPRTAATLLLLLVSALIALASRTVIAAPSRAVAAGVALALCVTVTSVVEQTRVIFSRVDNGPLGAANERGFMEVVARLNALPGAAAVVAPKDISYYYRGRSYTLEDTFIAGAEDVLSIARRHDVKVIVEYAGRPVVADPSLLPPMTTETIGTFRLYIKP